MDGRMGTPRRRAMTRAAIVVTSAALLFAACGESSGVGVSKSDDNGTGSVAGATTTLGPTTTEAPVTTEAATSTLPPTTVPPSTAAPTTTEAPTTTVGGVPSGWQEAEFPDLAYPPCCASNWYGQPSPAAPADPAAPLPDGIYRMIAETWDPARPDELVVELHRFEQCSVLPEGRCEFYETYEPTELGYEEAPFRTITLPLDATIGAGVTGWGDCAGTNRTGNGADLAALITAWNTAYQATIWPRVAAGEDPNTVLEDLHANPAGGFGPATGGEACGSPYEIMFDPGTGAPPLLMQTVVSYSSDYDSATWVPLGVMEQLLPTILEVHDGGQLRPYFYAGFYS